MACSIIWVRISKRKLVAYCRIARLISTGKPKNSRRTGTEVGSSVVKSAYYVRGPNAESLPSGQCMATKHKGHGGGPAATSGYNYQAAVTAIAMAYALRGASLGWLEGL